MKKFFKLTPNSKRVFENVYWALIGKFFKIFSSFIVGIFVARYLGPEQYGLMSYIISYVTLFSIFSSFGLDSIEIRELSKDHSKRNIILGTAFVIRLILSCSVLVLVLITLLMFEADQSTFLMIVVYSLSILFGTLNVIRNYFTSIVKNEFVVKSEIQRSVIGACIKVVLLVNHCSLSWFIVANTFDFFLIASGYLYVYHKHVGPINGVWSFDRMMAQMLIRESFPLLLSGAAIIVYQKIDQIMIRNMLDNNSVGQFAIAAGIIEYLVFIPTVIAQTVTPLLVRLRQSDSSKYDVSKQQFMDILVWSSVFISLIISTLAAPIITLLYGNDFAEAIPVLRIMVWKLVFVSLFVGSGQIIIIENLQKYAVLRNVIACVVCVGLNYLFIPVWGIIGSAIVSIFTLSFSGYLSHIVIKPYKYLFKMQTSSLFCGIKRISDTVFQRFSKNHAFS